MRFEENAFVSNPWAQYHTPKGTLFNVQIKYMENDINRRRTRNYATIVYRESAPKDWLVRLSEQCVRALVSPCHNRDKNDDGTLKKEHFHVVLMFDGVKTIEQAREVFDVINGIGVEPIKCLRAYARYLCHLDNEDKFRYNTDDVISFAGADYYSLINLATDKYSAISEMMDFCVENDIISYAQLLLYSKNNREDWFRVLCDNGTVTIVNFLRSRGWELREGIIYNTKGYVDE